MTKAIRAAYRAICCILILAILFLGVCILRSLHARESRPQVFINAQLVKEAHYASI